jgi:hypothetical protein
VLKSHEPYVVVQVNLNLSDQCLSGGVTDLHLEGFVWVLDFLRILHQFVQKLVSTLRRPHRINYHNIICIIDCVG